MVKAVLLADIGGRQGPPGPGLENSMQFQNVGKMPPLKADWIGLAVAGIYRLPNQAAVDAITDRPEGSGPALVNIEPLGVNGSRVTWKEYGGLLRVWERSVSTTAANNTEWTLLSGRTRRVLHQLSLPSNTELRDTAPARHARVPIRLACTVPSFDITFKNFNEQYSRHYGEVDFVNVYIGRRAKDSNGNYTANFEGTPTNLGTPVAVGTIGGTPRRYVLTGVSFELLAGVEYILSYAFTDPDGTANHMGIGGSYLGTNPLGVGSTAEVTNVWSENTPLDVYLTLNAPVTTPTIGYIGSSSETGLKSPYPLRDSWCWRHAEERGALPVMMGHSGATLSAWASPSRYTWTKMGSGFDRIDTVYICPGSNDIYQGTPLSELKTFLSQLIGLVNSTLSNNIIFTTIFPRRTETAAVKAVRIGYNQYLTTLPGGGLLTVDRERAISTDAGLMRPELDSGDGTHVTAEGQALLAAAVIGNTPVPDGKVILRAPNGNSFLVTVGNTGTLTATPAT